MLEVFHENRENIFSVSPLSCFFRLSQPQPFFFTPATAPVSPVREAIALMPRSMRVPSPLLSTEAARGAARSMGHLYGQLCQLPFAATLFGYLAQCANTGFGRNTVTFAVAFVLGISAISKVFV